MQQNKVITIFSATEDGTQNTLKIYHVPVLEVRGYLKIRILYK